jgi:hypothetical protein
MPAVPVFAEGTCYAAGRPLGFQSGVGRPGLSLMGTTVDQRFVPEGLDPFRNVTDLAIFFGQMTLYAGRTLVANMYFSRAVANLASGILEIGRLLKADKTAGLAVAGGVTGIALFDLFRCEVSLQPLYAGKGFCLFGIGDEALILFRMAGLAGIGADIDRRSGLGRRCWPGRTAEDGKKQSGQHEHFFH